MQAGSLRHIIDLKARDVGTDAYGALKNTWGREKAGVHAEVRELVGRELLTAQKIHPEISHRVTIRYLSGVSPLDRVIFEGRVLDIQVVLNPDGRRIAMELYCIERVGAPAV
jgi:SPP1 family predicted phage head-tail adaptor